MKKLLLAALTFATLGITSYAQLNYDYADYLKEYDKAFLAKNPHQIYAIKRDNYTIHGREFGDVNSKKVRRMVFQTTCIFTTALFLTSLETDASSPSILSDGATRINQPPRAT
jgi:hypothetical protein